VCPSRIDGQTSFQLDQEIFDGVAILSTDDQAVVAQYEYVCVRVGEERVLDRLRQRQT
jgi:hypothetical protein